MKLLLDTNILVPMVDGRGRDLPAWIVEGLTSEEGALGASVASIWEVAIKHRLGKLPLPCPLADWPAALMNLNVTPMQIRTAHVIQTVDPPPPVKDPFDRLLLAVCAAEGMRLMTVDEKLLDHPLAWRPA